jgi:hypothetical protein
MEGKNTVLNWKQAWSDNQKSVKRKVDCASRPQKQKN